MKHILDWQQYLSKAAQAAAEGIVLLQNNNHALPILEGEEVAVFGRIQLHYYKSGTGSGGMVNVAKVTGIVDGLQDAGVRLNQALLETYRKWDAENPYDMGEGWGLEPWCQEEMPLTQQLVQKAAQESAAALVVIGRTAGEEQDNRLERGSFLLTEKEEEMLRLVRCAFSRVIVILNVGNIVDMSFMDDPALCPDAVLYVWQGGMTGGTGTASVLTGACSPSGKLPDTIARSIADHPSHANFGGEKENVYAEDIFMGYRYFETFAKDRVRYPFGFGLSYTDFSLENKSFFASAEEIRVQVTVRNTGERPGKEVVQIYCGAPQGTLCKPARVLCGYEKTPLLAPGASVTLHVSICPEHFASYDDRTHRWILEKGIYHFYAGTDVRSAALCGTWELSEDRILRQCRQALAPVESFRRLCGDNAWEDAPALEIDEAARRLEGLPADIPYTGDRGIRLRDVRDGKASMEDFLAQLSDEDLACIVRGEGMGSPKVTPGTASAFGGVTEKLAAFGIPCACCSDGPSGMRLDCGTKAFSLPGGTMLAATFNRPLLTELYTLVGLEMAANKVDCLLGPGMNLHRHPLNGRNFEYFSEDPYLTGTIAAAELKGMHSSGVTGTIKHFCGNNQETGRHILNSVISERALRELYLKGFEIAVREGQADSVMTTYGAVNGLWTAGSYDLCTEILRREWGFTGLVMTDWWADINRRGQEANVTDLAAMVSAQNDVYMVCADSGCHEDNTLSALESGMLTRGELQRCAGNICRFLLTTNAMKRICGEEEPVEILNRPKEQGEDMGDVPFYSVDKDFTLDLTDIPTEKGTTYSFALDLKTPGMYRMTLTASSRAGALAQIPVTLFSMGTAYGTYTWNGTEGRPVSFTRDNFPMFSRFTTLRLYFAQSGLTMHSIRFVYLHNERNGF